MLRTHKLVNDNYIKKERNLPNTIKENNTNYLKASFTSRRDKKIILNDNIIFHNINNNSNNLTDIQNIVKLVDNVNQSITKLLNNNNSTDFSLVNNLRNSNKLSNENKKVDFTLKKKYLTKKEKVKNINAYEIFKKDDNIVKNILKYLPQKETIFFYSMNNFFNKGRIMFLDNKKEELLSILNLRKDETIENKINEIKNKFNEEDLLNKKIFEFTKETFDLIKKMNTEEFFNKLKNLEIKDKNNEYLLVIYKILFVLLKEENIYNILNKEIFWNKCLEYFNDNCLSNIGDFILEKVSQFNFDTKEFNIIESLIKDNKSKIINEILNNSNYLIIPLIKESLEYYGVIFSENKTEGSIYIKNLRKNQIIINYLNNLKVRYFLSKYNEEDDED